MRAPKEEEEEEQEVNSMGSKLTCECPNVCGHVTSTKSPTELQLNHKHKLLRVHGSVPPPPHTQQTESETDFSGNQVARCGLSGWSGSGLRGSGCGHRETVCCESAELGSAGRRQQRQASGAEATLRKTPLFDFHRESGGRWWSLQAGRCRSSTKTVTSAHTCHNRQHCSIFDVSHMLQTKVHAETGEVHGVSGSRDIAELKDNQVRPCRRSSSRV
ncbi:hypothetical protein INR49_021478 [Caranx melampygus]|nr:hypothetical protein INR49_021478 [Caranx melampygus]